ncbi:MAG: lasso RiPP family leader peptide-containing protein [Solirubrobacterales bacterium]
MATNHESGAAYEAPAVRDYGDLVELTAALSVNGSEDGASKAVPLHHSAPTAP